MYTIEFKHHEEACLNQLTVNDPAAVKRCMKSLKSMGLKPLRLKDPEGKSFDLTAGESWSNKHPTLVRTRAKTEHTINYRFLLLLSKFF